MRQHIFSIAFDDRLVALSDNDIREDRKSEGTLEDIYRKFLWNFQSYCLNFPKYEAFCGTSRETVSRALISNLLNIF